MSDKSLDVFGIKPIGDAALVVVQATVNGTGAFLSRICLPAAEEFGLLLRDKISGWRANNINNIAVKAEALIGDVNSETILKANPRIVGKIVELGSWEDAPEVQSMWAGLLASACTSDGKSQENLIYIRKLEQISSHQAKLLIFSCEKSKKHISSNGLIHASELKISRCELIDIFETDDIHKIDVALDYLSGIDMLAFGGGFNLHGSDAVITPSSLALHFYARCQGFSGSTAEFFQLLPEI